MIGGHLKEQRGFVVTEGAQQLGEIAQRGPLLDPATGALPMVDDVTVAAQRVGPEQSAYPHRSALFNLSIDPAWSDPAQDDAAIGWARSTWNTLRPFATGGVYVDFAGLDDEADELRDGVLGTSRDRLDSLRAEYDPDGLL